MRARDLGLVLAGQLITIVIASLVIVGLKIGALDGMPFVVGAVVGSQVGAWRFYRILRVGKESGAKVMTGLTLAAGAALAGLALHFGFSALNHPDVVIPISALGSFVFPFVLFGTMKKSLTK